MAEGGKQAIQADDDVVAASEVRELKRQIQELEWVLGKKTLENEILRDAVELAHQKKLISRLPSLPRDDTVLRRLPRPLACLAVTWLSG